MKRPSEHRNSLASPAMKTTQQLKIFGFREYENNRKFQFLNFCLRLQPSPSQTVPAKSRKEKKKKSE